MNRVIDKQPKLHVLYMYLATMFIYSHNWLFVNIYI